MKRVLLVFIFACVALAFAPHTSAASGFNAGRIIDDSVFANKSTMSVDAIQSFLNSKVTTCDTNGNQQSEMNNSGVPDYNGNGSIQRWEWGKYKYDQTSFPCLRNYKQDGVSAAQLIYNAAQTYSINPQVLIVLLQKEQGLITDTWPLNVQYRSATGYGCPDTAACDSKYYGLKNQIDWASKMFRSILDNSPNWYTPYVLGNNYIQYNPNSSCGGSTINIQNRSTQALYNYTPYQPNQAALDAGWGTATCGAYGNRNFYLYFTNWFGSTQGGPTHQWELESFDVYSDSSRNLKINEGKKINLQPGQIAHVTVKAKNTGTTAWQDDTLFETTNAPVLRSSEWLAYNRPAKLLNYPVGYNEIGTYTFTIKAPTAPGYYTQDFNIHHANTVWFNNQYATLNVDVVEPLPMPPITDINRLSSGQKMVEGDILYSPERHTVLWFRQGQLQLYINFKKTWSTDIPNSKATRLVNQPDGNLVLYTNDGEAVWASNTDGRGPSTLALQIDGNAVLYSSGEPTWATETSTTSQLLRVNSSISPGQVLLKNQKLSSRDRKSSLVMQSDGNLVLYTNDGKAVWASNTNGSNEARLVMQSDGNLVLYTNDGKAVWASNTNGSIPSSLVLQEDRNLVIYSNKRAIWASNTANK